LYGKREVGADIAHRLNINSFILRCVFFMEIFCCQGSIGARLPSRARRPGLAIAGRRKLRKRKENPIDPVNPVR